MRWIQKERECQNLSENIDYLIRMREKAKNTVCVACICQDIHKLTRVHFML